MEGSSPRPPPWERWGSAPSLTPVPSRSPAGCRTPYWGSSDTVQPVLLLGSACSPKLHFRSVLTLLKLLVIKDVTYRGQGRIRSCKGKAKNKTTPKTPTP